MNSTDFGSSFDLMLYNLGFSEAWKGTEYIREAVAIYRPGMMITKEVYPKVARRYSARPEQVERSCRRAIEMAAKNSAASEWQAYFGRQVFRPTVQQFVATIRRYWFGNDDE